MDCPEFLDRYTEFRDGLVTSSRELRRFQRHLVTCERCREYDIAVRRGVRALHASRHIEPSADFRRRLDERLRDERARAAAPEPVSLRVGIAAALLVAVALALVLRETTQRPLASARAPDLPPVAFPKPVANAGVPYVIFQDPRATVLAGNPNPYGTALVEPASATTTR
jgi:anti-sigma factor RsiW